MTRWLVGAAAAALAALLLIASASAQTPNEIEEEVLVSNTDVTASDVGFALWSQDLAQDFTTGSNLAGYRLSSIEISITTIGSNIDVPSVTLVSGSVSATDGTALAGPTSLTADATEFYEFTAPSNIILNGSTQYWIVVSHAGASGVDVRLNLTDYWDPQATDELVAADGWSIGDFTWWRELGSTGDFQWGGYVEPDQPSDATLDAPQAYLLKVTGSAVGGV